MSPRMLPFQCKVYFYLSLCPNCSKLHGHSLWMHWYLFQKNKISYWFLINWMLKPKDNWVSNKFLRVLMRFTKTNKNLNFLPNFFLAVSKGLKSHFLNSSQSQPTESFLSRSRISKRSLKYLTRMGVDKFQWASWNMF